MDQDLRQQFDTAVSGDPGADPGELARAAIADGGRIRHRRQRLAGVGMAAGVVAVLGVGAGVALLPGPRTPENPPVTLEAAMAPATAPSCTQQPDQQTATDVVLFLRDGTTDKQRMALVAKLDTDSRIQLRAFDTKEQAYESFKLRWADKPELRVTLVDALARLPVRDRAILVLRHAEDHSVETVATILGVSASVVKMGNARALARLRTLLDGHPLED
ncbi:sigma factor-like helix-turn-helix DNA-binding protein [Actinoplanes awajinensis]|uniref:RNA polymerase sigma-70 region 4 domain-containing protein n=1 Tax=Actinoplanes awajinensis subsp. mycoplanecinus TaxID=135947 RepID=A0A0X3VCA7_9ACTN|nr:sigma factor-like helix-turn-helix DNA-binding protein [Actinoplanes awajinensis]KUL42057.1 hypothetical protein ADL15_02155 [Actinoplanes awajinensis subsp. mycoplanecinus]